MTTKKMPGPRTRTPGEKTIQTNYITKSIEIHEPLPHNKEAEKKLIENLIFNPGNVPLVTSIVSPEDFYSRLRSQVYDRILSFYNAGRAWNGFTLEDSFQNDPNYLRYRDFFDDLLPWTGETASHNARIIKECSNQRKLIAATYEANLDLLNSVGIDVVKANLELVLSEVA